MRFYDISSFSLFGTWIFSVFVSIWLVYGLRCGRLAFLFVITAPSNSNYSQLFCLDALNLCNKLVRFNYQTHEFCPNENAKRITLATILLQIATFHGAMFIYVSSLSSQFSTTIRSFVSFFATMPQFSLFITIIIMFSKCLRCMYPNVYILLSATVYAKKYYYYSR